MINLTKKKEKQINFEKVKLPFDEKFTIVESLSIMLASGIPILEALDSIEKDSTSSNTIGIVKAVQDSVQKGKTLAESFSQFPKVFDEIFINTVRAGEESGSLDKVLKQLSDNLRQTQQIKSDLFAAIFYPGIVLTVLASVLAVLFGFVIPRFAEVFQRINVPKPLPTRLLISTSSFINQYYPFILAFLVIVILLTLFILSKETTRKRLINALFKLPIFGPILRYLDLARFSSTLSLLLSASIPIIRAVETSSSVVLNQNTRIQIKEITHELSEGRSLSDSMRKFKSFPTLMTRIISTGEQTGNLDTVLTEVSKHYHTKLGRQVKTLSTALEPVLIVIIGVIVGAVILAVIFPIYQMLSNITSR